MMSIIAGSLCLARVSAAELVGRIRSHAAVLRQLVTRLLGRGVT